MKTENSVIMKQAREALKGKWGLAVGTYIVFSIITIGIQNIPKVGPLLSLLVIGPLTLGLAIFSLALSRNQGPKFEQLFEGFKRYGTSLIAYLWISLFTLLWSLLLIIPGIIASLSYSMTFYILADEPTIAPREAINKSKIMMDGYKLKLFYLSFRFLGWALLAILTLGIGFLWLIPYIQVSTAKFYDDVKRAHSASPEASLSPVVA